MGQLRIEPKKDLFLPREKYNELLSILRQALDVSSEHNVFWDLSENEDSVKVRKEFMFVAEEEDIPVTVRRMRKTRSLLFEFSDSAPRKKRLTVEEAQERILTTLKASGKPMGRVEIVASSGISPSTWNLRVRELVDKGKIKRVDKPSDGNGPYFQAV